MAQPLSLGIDLGTTSIKIVLINEAKETIMTVSEPHQATIRKLAADRHEQDPLKMLHCLEGMMQKLSKKIDLKNVAHIGIAGQMHGVVRWYSAGFLKHCNNLEKELIEDSPRGLHTMSSLVTWMDMRAQKDFIRALPKPASLSLLNEGFGMVSLAWLYKHETNQPYCYDTCGSVGDLLTTKLCMLNKVTTTDHVAASWGYYDHTKTEWELSKITDCGIPGYMLPLITSAGNRAGILFAPWHGINAEVPVYATVGDLQATFLAHNVNFPNLAILNISTSAQLTLRMPVGFQPPKPNNCPIQYVPYFEDTFLAVAASLNGGNALDSIVQNIRNMAFQLTGAKVDEKQLWAKVEKQLREPMDGQTFLEVKPAFLGERHAEDRGSIMNISSKNLTLRNLLKSTCRGVIHNLFEMMPCHFLLENEVDTILITGQGIKPWYKNVVEQVVNGRMRIISAPTPADASFGAALIANIKESPE